MKRILIIRTDRVGDVVMITAMIRELRRTFPDAYIAALTQPNTSSVLTNNPRLNAILVDDLKKETFWRTVKEIRKHKFTDALLVMPTERAAYQIFLAGIKNRIGVGHKLYEVITFMNSVSRNNYTPLRHEADYCMDLARKIGVETNNYQPEIFLDGEETIEAERFLSKKGVGNDNYKIFIHTGTRGSAPNWSEDKYLSLIQRILETNKNSKLKIILTAMEMTNKFLTGIQNLNSVNIINMADDLRELRDLIKVISKADILISSSTGPLHIADALNIKCIGLYCSRPMSCSTKWGVINNRSINLQIKDSYCKNNCSKDQNTCAFENGISIEEVITSINFLQNIN